MPKGTQKSVCEKHNLLNEESEVPSDPEETASSDQEVDQEPDPEIPFQPSRAQQAIFWSVSLQPYQSAKSVRK